jgi:hypothetical protein
MGIVENAASVSWPPEEVNKMIRTYADALLEEGEAKGEVREARKVIARLGGKQLGPAEPNFLADLDGITDIERLRRIEDRLFEASSWADLLGTL